MDNELERRLSIIKDKETQKQQLEYEINLVKKDCVDTFRNRPYGEISHLTSLHGAWYDQPTTVKHKKYTAKNIKNEYDRFMYFIQEKIFEDILEHVKFYDKLIITGYNSVCITVPFKYKTVKFEVRIPNIDSIHSFDDMMSYGFYSLMRLERECIHVEFARFYRCDELKENIQALLEKEINNER